MTLPIVQLKQARDIPIRAGHPWVFSNAICRDLSLSAGDPVVVHADNGDALGLGLYHPGMSIRIRMISKKMEYNMDYPSPLVGEGRERGASPSVESHLIDADFFARRFALLDHSKRRHLPPQTNALRISNADADFLPGLIVDKYDNVVVFQIHTAGAERYRAEIIDAIQAAFKPAAIVERSDVSSRLIEGLKKIPAKVHRGEIEGPVEFEENGIKFLADVKEGQKTGFYLDQREARLRIGYYAKGRHVLNLFSYTGALSVCAALGQTKTISTVDSSERALEIARKNFGLNGFEYRDQSKFQFICEDAFDFISKGKGKKKYDLIICDPPAFAKSGKDLKSALKAYTNLNRSCLEMLESDGILITSSCSGMVSQENFRDALRIAAGQAGRDAVILDSFGQPFDHTQKLSFPEGRYLKTFVLELTSD